MTKRNLFDELMEGMDALKAEREGKITLKTTKVEAPAPIVFTARQIAEIREKYQYSQGVFAAILATNVNTLRNWEQGRSEPNAQAKVLLKLVDTSPDFVSLLAGITTGKMTAKSKPKRKAKSKSNTRSAVRRTAVA